MKKWFRAVFNLKHLLSIIVIIGCYILMIILTSKSLVSLKSYSNFLSSRNYNYSVIIDKDIKEDTYAFYNKTITFNHDDKLINSVVLMDTQNNYTKNSFLDGYDLLLGEYEVAISANIASINNLKIGSIIQSKSKVTNTLNNYIVKNILPDMYGVSEKDNDRSKGIIIIGKSEEYLNNIETNYIYFYNDDYSLINLNGANIVGQLNSIKSIKNNINKIYLLQLGLLLIISIAVSTIFFIVILSFNKSIYLKRKEFGLSKLYNQIKTDFFIYDSIITTVTLVSFAISSIFLRFSIVLLLIEIIPFLMISVCSYVIFKNYIRRR